MLFAAVEVALAKIRQSSAKTRLEIRKPPGDENPHVSWRHGKIVKVSNKQFHA